MAVRWRERVAQARRAMGTWAETGRKAGELGRVAVNTFRWRMRRRRLERLQALGEIGTIPTEWQIAQASYAMLTEFILPSNREMYGHYDADEAWNLFLRFLDAPSTMLDPTGLAISRELLVAHLLHAVHVSAGYDVGLLHLIPGGLDALEEQLQALLDGRHPRQAALEAMQERPDYPERLLAAVRRYRADPRRHWQVLTYEVPADCRDRMEEGVERFGTIGRLMRHAASLPRTPLDSVVGLIRA